MDLNHLFDIGIAIVVAWIASLELRYKISNAKLNQLQSKDRDNAIKSTVVAEPDSTVNRELAEALGRKRDS